MRRRRERRICFSRVGNAHQFAGEVGLLETSMIRDPIIEEIRKIRRETEEACGHDWDRLLEHYRAVKVGGRRLINRKQTDRSLKMRKSSEFSDVVDATDRLTLEEKETLLEILRNRIVEERRAQLKREIEQSERKYAAGKCKPATPRQIMRDILK